MFIISLEHDLNLYQSAKKVHKLITLNKSRIFINRTAFCIIYLSISTITLIVWLFAYLFLTERIPISSELVNLGDLNNYIVPLAFIFIGVLILISLFFNAISVGVDTIVMCILNDIDENDGSENKPYYMSTNFRNLLKITDNKSKVD